VTEFDKYRYFILEGGRGGGKSQAVGRLFLYLADCYNLRMVCGREVQNSIKESVYTLMAELARVYNLNFDILASEIRHRELARVYNLNFDILASEIRHRSSGSTMSFRGFREQGAFNIQGMEGVDVLWIDEAQAITKKTLDVLIPTIRKETDHS
jgi:phage terminase large subunit